MIFILEFLGIVLGVAAVFMFFVLPALVGIFAMILLPIGVWLAVLVKRMTAT